MDFSGTRSAKRSDAFSPIMMAGALDKVTGTAIISGLKLDQDAIESVAGQDFDNP
jgi:hypothetical protein